MDIIQPASRVARLAYLPRSTTQRVFGTMLSSVSDTPAPDGAVTIDGIGKLNTASRSPRPHREDRRNPCCRGALVQGRQDAAQCPHAPRERQR